MTVETFLDTRDTKGKSWRGGNTALPPLFAYTRAKPDCVLKNNKPITLLQQKKKNWSVFSMCCRSIIVYRRQCRYSSNADNIMLQKPNSSEQVEEIKSERNRSIAGFPDRGQQCNIIWGVQSRGGLYISLCSSSEFSVGPPAPTYPPQPTNLLKLEPLAWFLHCFLLLFFFSFLSTSTDFTLLLP